MGKLIEVRNDTEKKIDIFCKTRCLEYFSKDENIVGLGRGEKIKGGQSTGEVCIIFYVKQKIADGNLSDKNYKIEKLMDGNLPTDVIECGELKPLSLNYYNQNPPNSKNNTPYNSNYYKNISDPYYNNLNNFEDVYTPHTDKIQSGMAIRVNTSGFSTLGCLVTSKDGKQVFLLTCRHAVDDFNTTKPRGTAIYEATNKPTLEISDRIAVLAKVTDLVKYNPAILKNSNHSRSNSDAAIALISANQNNPDLLNKLASDIIGIGAIKGILSPITVKTQVKKYGAKSKLSEGVIEAVSCSLKINYPTLGPSVLVDQIVTTNMAEVGDSGSIGLDNNNFAFGLLVGGSNVKTFYSPIVKVLDDLNVMLKA